jgi:hypothetical protein
VAAVLGRAEDPGPGELRDGQPECGRYFRVGGQRDRLGEREDERPDQDRGEHGAARRQIIQLTQAVGSLEQDANLFPSLPDGGAEKVGIIGRRAAAGESEVAGPDVSVALGAADQQNRVGIRGKDQRNRGAGPDSRVVGPGNPPGENIGELTLEARNPRASGR